MPFYPIQLPHFVRDRYSTWLDGPIDAVAVAPAVPTNGPDALAMTVPLAVPRAAPSTVATTATTALPTVPVAVALVGPKLSRYFGAYR